MADPEGRELLDEGQLAKRKPEEESATEQRVILAKKQRAESDPDPLPEARNGEEDGDADNDSPNESNGKPAELAVDKGKGLAVAVDKGKGKMVVEDGDDDDSEDDVSDDGALGEDYASDFSDDPLAEVDLSNILPSRTRRREPPPPGAYLVNEQDEDDDDEEEEEDVSD